MQRSDALEAAIRELVGLLGSRDDREAAYQEWFERHPLAWEALGYVRAMPHPRLLDEDGRLLVPDFLAERPNRLADVIDLKTPTLPLLVKAGQARVRASAATYEAIVQLREYSAFFASKARRDRLTEDTGIVVPEAPAVVLIGGSGIEHAEDLHRVEQQFGSTLTVISYDDLLHRLQLRHRQENEQPGEVTYYGFYAIVMVKDVPSVSDDSFLFDVGLAEDHDRLSICLDGLRRVSFIAISTSGNKVRVRSRSALELGYWYRLFCEVSISAVTTVATIRIDGSTQGRAETWEGFHLSLEVLDARMTMGADVNGRNGAAMGLHSHAILNGPIDILDRSRLEIWGAERIAAGQLGGSWVDFDEHQFLERGELR